jgi:hypothetical protein
MTAAVAEIIREVETAGGHLTAKGSQLQISAPLPLPERLVEDLRRSKADVLTFLSGGRGTWDADDWREWITERAAILEYDGGLPRPEADRRAFLHALVEWCNRHPPEADPNLCAGCGGAINTVGTDWRPLGDGATVHYGGRHGLQCFEAHGAKRRDEACKALAALGLAPSSGKGNA